MIEPFSMGGSAPDSVFVAPKAWIAMYRLREARFGRMKEGPWRILCDLAARGPCTVSSAALASGCPETTGLRHVGELEAAGWIARDPHPKDARSAIVRLTAEARARMGLADG